MINESETKLNLVRRIADVLELLTIERKTPHGHSPIPVYNLEPVIKQREAARMLGVTTKALAYHVRKGRIRVVKPAGAKRAMGYVAADIRAMLDGTIAERTVA